MRRTLAAAAALALGACAARAESAPGYLPIFDGGMKSFGLQLGLAKPIATNGASQWLGPGPAIGFQYLRYPIDWVALGLEFDYLKFGKKVGLRYELAPYYTEASMEGDAMALSALLRLNILQERSWTPYLFGGAGYHQTKLKLAITNNFPTGLLCILEDGSTVDCARAASGSESAAAKGLSVIGGGGIEAFVLRGMSLALEVRFHQLREGSDSAGALESLTYFLGARFLFGLD